MKKLFLTLVLALSTLRIWAHDVQIDDIYYNLDTSAKTAEVTFKGSTYYNVQTYSGSVTIPGTIVSDGVTFCVTGIGDYAFYNCSGLTSVMIPNSVTNIGGYTFYGCTGLTSLTNYATTPQTLDLNVFNGFKISKVTLYVPKSSVEAYKSADTWKKFNIQVIPSHIR